MSESLRYRKSNWSEYLIYYLPIAEHNYMIFDRKTHKTGEHLGKLEDLIELVFQFRGPE
jgi:hypothetical protein